MVLVARVVSSYGSVVVLAVGVVGSSGIVVVKGNHGSRG